MQNKKEIMKNKFILRKVLLVSSFTLISTISLGVVSCEFKNTKKPGEKPEKETPKLSINDVLKKVTADVQDKSQIEAIKVKKEMIVFSNYDSTMYDVEIKEIIPNNANQLLLIKFIVKDKANMTSSEENTIEIKDFKKFIITTELLNQLIKKVKFDYQNKENIPSWKAEEKGIVFTEYDSDAYEIIKENVKISKDNLSLNFSFYLKDKNSDTKSEANNAQINGFKVIKPEESSLSELFWGDTKGLLHIPNNKRQDLLDALNRKKTTFILNVTNRKFVAAVENKDLDLLKPNTYKELGTIDEEFIKKQIDAFEIIMKSTFGNVVYPKFKKFLSSKKEEQLKIFSEVKELIRITSFFIKDKVTFADNWLTTIEELIKRDVQQIVLNFKSGEFVVQKDPNVQINLHNQDTFKVIATLSETFLKKLHQEMLDQLTSSKISTNAFDKFFRTENTPFFSFEKTLGIFTIGVGIDHSRS